MMESCPESLIMASNLASCPNAISCSTQSKVPSYLQLAKVIHKFRTNLIPSPQTVFFQSQPSTSLSPSTDAHFVAIFSMQPLWIFNLCSPMVLCQLWLLWRYLLPFESQWNTFRKTKCLVTWPRHFQKWEFWKISKWIDFKSCKAAESIHKV